MTKEAEEQRIGPRGSAGRDKWYLVLVGEKDTIFPP